MNDDNSSVNTQNPGVVSPQPAPPSQPTQSPQPQFVPPPSQPAPLPQDAPSPQPVPPLQGGQPPFVPLPPLVPPLSPPTPPPTPPPQPTPPTPSQTTGSSNDDPLAALEALLKQNSADQQGNPGGDDAPAGEGAASPGSSPTTENPSGQAEKLRKKAELDAIVAKSADDTQAQLAAQEQALDDIKSMPQYQARMKQEEEAQAKAAEEKSASDGLKIRQIQHTKI